MCLHISATIDFAMFAGEDGNDLNHVIWLVKQLFALNQNIYTFVLSGNIIDYFKGYHDTSKIELVENIYVHTRNHGNTHVRVQYIHHVRAPVLQV
jgi:hypothetical protein